VEASETLVRVTRGGVVESTHRGAVVLVEDGRETLVLGDPDRVVFYRSANKPLQAIEVVACGAADAFGLAPAELAIAAGSHSGEPRHLETVRSLLAKAGVPESALRCGGHRSSNPSVAFAQRRDGVPVTSILSNCSGKHAAMLASAKHRGAPLEGYLDPAHPVQASIRAHVAAFAGIAPEALHVGVDGCGAPAFALPLRAMARSIATFGAPRGVAEPLARAARRIAAAMLAHPEMVAGEERFDTDLMRAGEGRVLAKAGAEGVHGCAVPARAAGFAVKVDDGSDRGYRTVVLDLLVRLGGLSREAADRLAAAHAPRAITSLAGAPAGTLESVDVGARA
jgi:L-asparaginase II